MAEEEKPTLFGKGPRTYFPCSGPDTCPLCKMAGPPNRVITTVTEADGAKKALSLSRATYDRIKGLVAHKKED